MPAPSKAWVTISDSQVDADSPLDTVLMTGMRDNLIHLKEWLGDSFASAKNHNHDGVNSARTTLDVNLVQTWDDFHDPNVSAWAKTGTVGVVVPGKNGLCSVLGGAGWGGIDQIGRPWILSGPTITFEATVKNIDSSTVHAFVGFSEDNFGTMNNSIAFRRNNSSTNWRCFTVNGGVATDSDSGIAFVTGAFKTFKIIATPTSIAFYIDGSLVATNTTNIPTAAYLGITIGNHGTVTSYIDYVHCYTTTRM